MLSYMLPVEDKPPQVPSKTHLQLQLEQQQQQMRGLSNGRAPPPACSKTPTISSESSVSSFSSSEVASSTASQSTVTPTTDQRPKPKLVINGTKHHAPLKRVSFGSSKGSMVETLIYESPLQEEPEASPILENSCPFPSDSEAAESEPSKRVRVTFFESEKPLAVTSPDPSELLLLDAAGPPVPIMTSSPAVDSAPPYDRQNSTDSGWDNPFRPDGDLSREADQIVELIKGGKPITPTPGSTAPKLPSVSSDDQADGRAAVPEGVVATSAPAATVAATPPGKAAGGANGAAPFSEEKQQQQAAVAPVEVKRETVVPPSDASQVEHVVLKKKPKCKCCVIQ